MEVCKKIKCRFCPVSGPTLNLYSFLYLEWCVLLAAAPSRSLCSLKSNKRKAQTIMLYSKWGHEGTSLPVAFFGDGTSSPVAFFWYYFAFPHLSGRKSQVTNLCLWITNTNEIWECSIMMVRWFNYINLFEASKIYAANSGSGADWLFLRKKKLAGKKDEVPPAVDLGRGGVSVSCHYHKGGQCLRCWVTGCILTVCM